MNVTTVLILLFGFSGMGLVHADKIRIATDSDNPPFNMKNEKGELIGFEVDLAKALCYFMQVECELVEHNKDEIIPALLEKKYDAVIASMAVTTELQEQVAFSDPYYSNYLHVIGKSKSDITVSAAGLKDKKIGAVRSSDSAQYLLDRYADAAIIELYDANDDAFQDLKSGLLDAVLVSAHEGNNWLIKVDNSGYDIVGEKIDIEDKAAIAIRKDDKALKEKLDSALQTILANGTYKRINWNYFPYDVY